MNDGFERDGNYNARSDETRNKISECHRVSMRETSEFIMN